MKKLVLIGLMLSTAGGTSSISAAPYVLLPGSVMTTGPLSLPYSLQSVTHNPASGSLVLRPKETMRMGYFSGLGMGLEYGDVANFEDDLNDLIDIVDESNVNFDNAEPILDRFNSVLPALGDAGYLKLETRLNSPFFPLVTRFAGMKGEMAINLAMDHQLKGSLLDSPLQFNDSDGSFGTDSAVYVKSAVMTHFDIGYSQSVWTQDSGRFQGNVIAGARLNVYNVELSKQVVALEALDGEDLADYIKDEYENNQVKSSDVGIDLGVIWVAKNYHLGFTITSINEPEFEFGIVGVGCDSIVGAVAEANCAVARKHIQELRNISSSEVHVMNALATIDASYLIKDNWAVSFSYELAEYNDLVGDENQWMTLSTSYYPGSGYIPAPRFGYKSNSAGSKISSVMFGATFFKIFNLDLEVALDKTTIDESSAPRSLAFAFGFEEQY